MHPSSGGIKMRRRAKPVIRKRNTDFLAPSAFGLSQLVCVLVLNAMRCLVKVKSRILHATP